MDHSTEQASSSSDSSSNSGLAKSETESDSESSICTSESDTNQNVDEASTSCEDLYANSVKLWAHQIPIGLGLCPWAVRSKRIGYKTCPSSLATDVAAFILSEARVLSDDDVVPLNTTLVVCPHVTEFEQFSVFDTFVRDFPEHAKKSNNELEDCLELLQAITLVSFHPNFQRWHGLPEGVQVGSEVQSHRPIGGFQKSLHKEPATVLETSNKVFGRRKIKLRFHQDDQENYVAIDWFTKNGPLLPDNAMHQSPYPTIHIIRNQDLAALKIRDVSRVKRKNAQRMMKLGWEGLNRKLNSAGSATTAS